ncbi:MAG: DUF2958 domain-containing protein [Candidatus Obscuribacterales bacterium]
MALLTEKDRQELPALYSQENTEDPVAQIRFYDTLGGWSWYGIEFDGEDLFFGLVLGFERELGYFTLAELEQVNQAAGFTRIERDPGFQPTELSKIQR